MHFNFKPFFRIVVFKDLCSWLIPLNPWTPFKLTLYQSFLVGTNELYLSSFLHDKNEEKKKVDDKKVLFFQLFFFFLVLLACLLIIASIHMLWYILNILFTCLCVYFEYSLTCYLWIYLTCLNGKYFLELIYTC